MWFQWQEWSSWRCSIDFPDEWLVLMLWEGVLWHVFRVSSSGSTVWTTIRWRASNWLDSWLTAEQVVLWAWWSSVWWSSVRAASIRSGLLGSLSLLNSSGLNGSVDGGWVALGYDSGEQDSNDEFHIELLWRLSQLWCQLPFTSTILYMKSD